MKAEMIAFSQLTGRSNFLSILEQVACAKGVSITQLLEEAIGTCIAQKESLES